MSRRSDLLRLLAAHSPTDPEEQLHLTRALDMVAAAHDPFDRHEFRPGHVTASAFVLHPDGGSILLVHHVALGLWVQPGGHIEPADGSALEAAAREVAEETGITDLEPVTAAIVDVDVHPFPRTEQQPEHLHLDMRFGFVAGDDGLSPSTEVLEALWAGPGDLDRLGADRSITRAMAKLLGDLS